MTTATPVLGLVLYNSTTDQASLFSTFRSDWGGIATTSNFYKIDTAIGNILTSITDLQSSRGSPSVFASFISANYYEATTSLITAYTTNMTILLNLNTDSNGTVTLNINGLGTKSVMKVNNSGTIVNITGAELQSGKYYLFVYDGTRFVWTDASSGDQIYMAGTSGNVVTVNSDNTLIQETPYNVLKSGIVNAPITSSSPSILDFIAVNQADDFENIDFDIVKNDIKFNSISPVVSTYSLVYTTTVSYVGGVLAQSGDIHFIPYNANRGQKVSSAGVVSTYSLVYTVLGAYEGGVLALNGDIHFIPASATVGQKLSNAGVVSTYSLVYTTGTAYVGGVLALNGDIHFVPLTANRGQKISSAGVVSTYSLVYTTSSSYTGGVLALNGDIHFVPAGATVGQKVSSAGVVSTYSLVYTAASYRGGVLALNGDIHFVPFTAAVGQKVSSAGVVSTYSLVHTTTNSYTGGVLSSNGDIHFVPYSTSVGQKVSSAGVVSTYSLAYTVSQAYFGGIVNHNGEGHFVPLSAVAGQKIIFLNQSTLTPPTVLQSPYLNKL